MANFGHLLVSVSEVNPSPLFPGIACSCDGVTTKTPPCWWMQGKYDNPSCFSKLCCDIFAVACFIVCQGNDLFPGLSHSYFEPVSQLSDFRPDWHKTQLLKEVLNRTESEYMTSAESSLTDNSETAGEPFQAIRKKLLSSMLCYMEHMLPDHTTPKKVYGKLSHV